nr:hypothetical protein [Porphyromonas gulae]
MGNLLNTVPEPVLGSPRKYTSLRPPPCDGLGSKNCRLYSHERVARNFLRFGSEGKIFTRQSEKILAPFSQDSQTTIRAFSVRNLSKWQVLSH